MTSPSNVPPLARNPEQRLVSEYLVSAYPDRRHATRVPVGPIVPGADRLGDQVKALRLSRPFRPEVDALVWLDRELVLIEGKVADYMYGLAKLPGYKRLIATTPELAPYWTWPVRMVLVIPVQPPWATSVADDFGVEVVEYIPDWIQEYWNYRQSYWTGDYRRAREAKLEARRRAGVE